MIKGKLSNSHIHYYRLVSSLVFRLRTNSLKTKFSKNVKCICGQQISLEHILFDCQIIKKCLPHSLTYNNPSKEDMQDALNDSGVLTEVAQALLHSAISDLL